VYKYNREIKEICCHIGDNMSIWKHRVTKYAVITIINVLKVVSRWWSKGQVPIWPTDADKTPGVYMIEWWWSKGQVPIWPTDADKTPGVYMIEWWWSKGQVPIWPTDADTKTKCLYDRVMMIKHRAYIWLSDDDKTPGVYMIEWRW
jgi:hypothetical protein